MAENSVNDNGGGHVEPPTKSLMFMRYSVSGASLSIIMYVFYMILYCGCN